MSRDLEIQVPVFWVVKPCSVVRGLTFRTAMLTNSI